ncbi:uncharacterized protein N7515_007469 [Penicillium bovifimosum]|uniref:Uncharacterized protein n=1 Tax=Penicillium bovifimosum TaxID=126998 RepID=A0A9W9GWN9_9EURO|nr:uncharacterized protein N7515_007469 [Penicillium bovifimosum]KAJ5131430.1 hypothetical protein N7515_007469 [Penicillium bovifimosum]
MLERPFSRSDSLVCNPGVEKAQERTRANMQEQEEKGLMDDHAHLGQKMDASARPSNDNAKPDWDKRDRDAKKF